MVLSRLEAGTDLTLDGRAVWSGGWNVVAFVYVGVHVHGSTPHCRLSRTRAAGGLSRVGSSWRRGWWEAGEGFVIVAYVRVSAHGSAPSAE
jgi:hypothetical protein